MPLTHRVPSATLLVAAVVASALTTSLARAADPTTADCLNASESSIKLRSDHKLRAAREQLLVCSLAACPTDVRAECARRVEIVNASIPTIVFEAKDAAVSRGSPSRSIPASTRSGSRRRVRCP